jgi:hypothetical protein
MTLLTLPLFPLSLLWIWFALTALSVAYVAWDLFTSTPEMKVMKWGWVLVTLYTGPVGLLIHCAAGDATGIIVAAAITGYFGLRMGVDIWLEYAAGFVFGLFIFQALFMKDMMKMSYGEALRSSFLPEWMSMNAMMAGMLPTMVILMSRDMRAMEATSPWFWAAMSAATLAGVLVSYPVNYWLVKNQLKHGMGTERALGKGGAVREEVRTSAHAGHSMAAMAGMNHAAPPPNPVAGHAGHHIAGMPPMAVASPAAAHAGHDMAAMGMGMGGAQVSGLRKAAVTLLTLAMLAVGYWLAARYGDLSMRPGQPMMNMPGMAMPGHQM